MRRTSNPSYEEVDTDSQFRAIHDDDCDLAIFLGGCAVDEELNGPRDERLPKLLRGARGAPKKGLGE